MKKRLLWDKIFDPSLKLPKTEEEILVWAEKVFSDLSPENLTCDGELSGGRVRSRLAELNRELKELEKLLGRKIEESDVYS